MSKTSQAIETKDGQMYADPEAILQLTEFNVRQHFGNMEDLSEDILVNGIRVPLEVAKGEAGMLDLIDGHRRLQALFMAKEKAKKREINAPHLDKVPIQFEKPGSKPVDRLVSMYVRNTGKPFEPMEEQALFQRMKDLHFKPKDIAAKIGRSLAYVEGRLSLGAAPEEVKRAVREKKITVGAAKAISHKPKEEQEKVIKTIRETSGSKKVKSRDVKALAGVKSMRTEKEIRMRLKRYQIKKWGGGATTKDNGWFEALGWVLGEEEKQEAPKPKKVTKPAKLPKVKYGRPSSVRYSDEQKREVKDFVKANKSSGGSIAQAVEKFGVAKSTIQKWMAE